jgi:heat shock protein HslJ
MKKIIYVTLCTFFCLSTLSACKLFNQGTLKPDDNVSKLSGNWELNYISGVRIAFNGLYPGVKPSVSFSPATGELHGNTSCNPFSSKIVIDGNKINISEPGAMTMRFCEGEGEKRFLEMLKKVDRYDANDNTLTLIQGDIAVMRFAKK